MTLDTTRALAHCSEGTQSGSKARRQFSHVCMRRFDQQNPCNLRHLPLIRLLCRGCSACAGCNTAFCSDAMFSCSELHALTTSSGFPSMPRLLSCAAATSTPRCSASFPSPASDEACTRRQAVQTPAVPPAVTLVPMGAPLRLSLTTSGGCS